MNDESNPYAAPDQFGGPNLSGGNARPLADLGKRFLGAVVDLLSGIVFAGPGYALMFLGSLGNNGRLSIVSLLGMGLMAVGGLVILGAQIYLLATRSQTIGKVVMKTQIIDFNTGQPAELVHAFVLRALVNGLICSVPCLGFIYFIVDSCFIFREDRRCIHDLLASTVVVDIS